MSGSVNKVILIGNLGQDPDVRHTQDGRPVVNLSIATSENWKDKNTGEKRERTEWHRIVIFNEGLARIAEQYLKKGSKIYVEGQLQTRKWQDKSGNDRYSTEVVLQGFNSALTMLDSKGSGFKQPAGAEDYGMDPDRAQGGSQGGKPDEGSYAEHKGGFGAGAPSDLDDDIPF